MEAQRTEFTHSIVRMRFLVDFPLILAPMLEILARRVILGELGLGGVGAAAVLIFPSAYGMRCGANQQQPGGCPNQRCSLQHRQVLLQDRQTGGANPAHFPVCHQRLDMKGERFAAPLNISPRAPSKGHIVRRDADGRVRGSGS